MANIFEKTEKKITNYLSHRPRLYALIVGIGIVLFWRGVWHSVDQMHSSFFSYMSLVHSAWWDGPISFIVGTIILYFTGAFTSSFIGNELILSGLRGEKRLSEKTETELKNEVTAIADIKDELLVISQKLEILQEKAHKNHKNI